MPRFVRPAWLTVTADGPTRGTGPRARDGWLHATLTLRTGDGTVSDPVALNAGGAGGPRGSGRAMLTIPATMQIHVTGADGVETVYAAGSIRALEIVA